MLDRHLGVFGADLAVTILNVAGAGVDDDSAFDRVVTLTQAARRTGREPETAVVRKLERLPETPSRERQFGLFHGLQKWHSGERDAAVGYLRPIAEDQFVDRASGIAGHLVAVRECDIGNEEAAKEFADKAVDVLRALGDGPGLVQTLATLGRIQRELAPRSGRAAGPDWEVSIRTLREAIDLGDRIDDSGGLAAVPRMTLATTLMRADRLEEAELEARTALEVMRDVDDRRYIPQTLLLLGSILRRRSKYDEALRVLGTAAKRAAGRGDTHSRAVALNVMSSVEVNRGNAAPAVQHARASVALGEEMSDLRHLSQALHQLARAIVELPDATRDQLVEARRAAKQSERLLRERRDQRGLRMVSSTLELVEKRISSLS